jgi:hypothetical protein
MNMSKAKRDGLPYISSTPVAGRAIPIDEVDIEEYTSGHILDGVNYPCFANHRTNAPLPSPNKIFRED